MPSIRFYKLRGRSLLRPLLLLTAFVMWFEGCTLPKEPGSLWWDVDLVVPMGVRTYGIWDLADPDSVLRAANSGIGMDEDSNAFFSLWTETSVAMEDCLCFQPMELEVMRPLDAIQVPINLDSTFYYSLGSLNPDIAALHGTTQNIEPHLINARQSFITNELVQHAVIDTGTARIVIINGLPYPVTHLFISMGTDENTNTIYEIDSLDVEQQLVLSASLTNIEIQSESYLELTGDGNGGSGIQVDSTDRITLAVQIDTITANEYTGRLPEQLLYGDSAAAIENQHLIEYATIRSGSIDIELSNQTQLDDTLTLVLPNIINQLGDSLVVSEFITAGSSESFPIDVEGLRINMTGTEPQLFEGRIFVHSQQTEDEREFQAGEEYASGRITISQLTFDFFRGTLREFELPIQTTGVPVERPPNGWETVHPTYVDAEVYFEETFGGIGEIALNLETLLSGSQIGQTMIEASDIPFDQDTSITVAGLDGLLTNYPDSSTLQGTLILNGYVSLFDHYQINMAVELQAPLMITLDDFHPPGTIEKISTGDLQDIKSGNAEVTVYNRLPVGGSVFVIAARDSLDLLVDSGADVDTVINVAILEPDIIDGRAITITQIMDTVQLSDSLIAMFQNPPFYTRTDIRIPGTNGDTLIVHGSDYLSVQILARLVYEIRTGEDY